MNVVLYLRYSSDAQTEQSIEGQRRVCEEYCARQKHTIINTYVDRAASASHDVEKRHAFLRMIRDSATHRFEAVVVYKLDRFSRNRYDTATYKNKLAKNGVRLISATENIGDDPESIILESVLEGMAEFYSKELSQKVKRGMHESALKANSCGGALPLGYKIENKKFVVDPLTAPVVQEIFARYAAGDAMADIYRDLNARGVRTRSGCEFTRSSFHTLLRNRRYLGIYTYNGIEHPGAIPQLVDSQTFEKVQEKLAETARAPSRGRADETYLLTEKAFCGHCGAPLIGDCGKGAQGQVYHYYTCAARKKDRSCDLKPIKKDWLERAVAEDALSLLTPSMIETLADMAVKAAEDEIAKNTAIPAIRDELKDITKRIDRLLTLVERGSDSESLLARLSDLESQKKAAQIRLADAEADQITIDRAQIVFFLSQFAGGSLDDPDFTRRVITMLVDRVTVWDAPDPDDTPRHRTVRITISYNLTGRPTHTFSADPKAFSDTAADGSPQKAYPNFSIYFAGRIASHTIWRRVD